MTATINPVINIAGSPQCLLISGLNFFVREWALEKYPNEHATFLKAAKDASAAADFLEDAGSDGTVTRDEFSDSIFELTDTWTLSTDPAEYEDFLNRGYSSVYKELIEKDTLVRTGTV